MLGLLSIASLSNAIVSTLENSMGIGYRILFNAIGIISIVLQFLIFQMKHKKRIVFVGVLSDIGWLSYFVLQGDLISGTANIIGLMSKAIILLGLKYAWAKSRWWNVFFLVFAGVFSVFTFKAWQDTFAVIACMTSILAYFMQKENHIRIVALVSFTAFMCNSISKAYLIALIADITALASCIISLIRYRKNGVKKPEIQGETATDKEDADEQLSVQENAEIIE